MKDLYKVFHQEVDETFKQIYSARQNFETTTKIGLTIKPINQPKIFELYYIPTNETIHLTNLIYKQSQALNNQFIKLPNIAKDQFIHDLLVDELYNTNDLEGVRSTKKEIANSVKEVEQNQDMNKRFHSLIMSYEAIISKQAKKPKTLTDIRKIYDDITKTEIKEADLPDGNLFRKDTTYVLKKSGSGKVIHRGVTPEENIQTKLQALLHLLNEHTTIPSLIKIAIGHYYFGYIHPFYDGNGRTGRFITSIYLAEEIGPIAALSLSQGCNKQENNYLESFERANSVTNHGELNHFIHQFLSIIAQALTTMHHELREKTVLLTEVANKIEQDPKLITASEKQTEQYQTFMFILAQNYFFSNEKGITTRELAETMNLSTTTIRTIAKHLLTLDIIEQKGQRPAYYRLTTQYVEQS